MRIDRSKGSRGKWAVLAAATAATLASYHTAYATDDLYTGATGTNWEDNANWSLGAPPTANDIAVFDATARTVNASALTLTAGGITLDSSVNQQIGQVGTGLLSLTNGATISNSGNGANFLFGDTVAVGLQINGGATFNGASAGGQLIITGNLSGSGDITLTGSSTAANGIGSNATNSASFTGNIILNSGSWGINTGLGLGANSIIMNGGILGQPGPNGIAIPIFVNGDATIVNGSNNGLITSVITVATTKTLTINGGGNSTAYGNIITGPGNLTILGPGTGVQFFGSNSNTLTGLTRVGANSIMQLNRTSGSTVVAGNFQVDSGAAVYWGGNEQINNNSAINLNGGTLALHNFANNAPATETVGVLTLTASSTIDFGAIGSSTLSFGDSHLSSWTTGQKLTLTNYGTDTADVLQIGTTASGLTASQLSQLRFLNPFGFSAGTYGASISSSGLITVGSQIVLNASWKNDADGNWNDDSNWNGGGTPSDSEASVLFGSAILAPRTVTLTTPVSIKDIVFDNANKYTIAGDNTTLVTVNGANGISVTSGSHQISAPVKLVSNASFTMNAGTGLTLGAVDANGNSVTVGGAGSLTTGNVTNTPTVWMIGTGNTVTMGDLTLTNAYLVGDGIGSHGSGNYTVGNITGGTQVTVFSPVSTSINVIGNISNVAGVITLRGGGSISTGSITNVTGINIYEDGFRSTGNINNTNGGTVQINGTGDRLIGSITNTGAITLGATGSTTVGAMTTVTSVTASGDGNFNLGAINTSGAVNVSGNGTHTLNDITSSQGVVFTGNGALSTGNISAASFSASGSGVHSFGTITTGGGLASFLGTNSVTIAALNNTGNVSLVQNATYNVGNMTSVGQVDVGGSGTHTFANINTNSQAVNLNGTNVLTVGAITGATNVSIGSHSRATITSISASGAVQFNSVTTGSLGGISSATSLALTGASAITLSGNNSSFSGTISLDAGSVLKLGGVSSLGTNTSASAVTAVGSFSGTTTTWATLDFSLTNSLQTISTPITYRYVKVVGNGDLTFNGILTPGTIPSGNNPTFWVDNVGGLTTLSNLASNANNVTFSLRGQGDVLITSNIVNTLANKSWGVGDGLTASAPGSYSGTVEFRPTGGNTVNANFLAGSAGNVGGVNNGIVIAVGNSNAFTGAGGNQVMILQSGITMKSVNSANSITRTDVRAASINFAGAFDLNFAGGIKTLGAASDTDRIWTVNTTGGARIKVASIGTQGTANTSLTYQSTVSSGIFEVDGAASYAGSTTIKDILFLANAGTNSATGTAGAVSVSSTGTIGGTGTVGGTSITINGNVAPGDTTGSGTLAMTNAVTLNSGSRVKIDVGGNTPGDNSAVGNYDQLNVTGGITLNGTVSLDVNKLTGASYNIGDVLYIVTRSDANSNQWTTTFNGLGEGATVAFGNSVATITYQANWTGTQAGSSLTGGNDVALLVTVPEPTTASLLLLGGAGMLARRRRRK